MSSSRSGPTGRPSEISRRGFLSMAFLLAAGCRRSEIEAQNGDDSSIVFLDAADVESVFEAPGIPAPAELSGLASDARRERWPAWIRQRDREIRARLLRGEEDTLANFVLFGVTFGDQPRVTPDGSERQTALIAARIEQFVRAAGLPGGGERLLLMKDLLRRLGFDTASPERRDSLIRYVENNVTRYLDERDQYRRAVSEFLAAQGTTAASAAEELYKDRGLSIDTDFRPNFAIESALADLKRRGLLTSTARVAIVGPGLDFIDKDSGFDYYPLQTLQPFALMDSILRLDLASMPGLSVTLFDISGQTLTHVAGALARTRSGSSYSLQLVLDVSRPWDAKVLSYWRAFGQRIGKPADPLPAPSQVHDVEQRAVEIAPDVVQRLRPVALNVVAQHLEIPTDQRFDLIIGTNIFVYYSSFERALAELNIANMLGPSGIFLTNDPFPDYPGAKLRPLGDLTVSYTAAQADRIYMYGRSRFGLQLPPG